MSQGRGDEPGRSRAAVCHAPTSVCTLGKRLSGAAAVAFLTTASWAGVPRHCLSLSPASRSRRRARPSVNTVVLMSMTEPRTNSSGAMKRLESGGQFVSTVDKSGPVAGGLFATAGDLRECKRPYPQSGILVRR